MPASPALRLIEGAGAAYPISLLIARRSVAFWQGAVDRASDDLVACGLNDHATRYLARARFYHACDQLQAALNRRDRLVAESQNLAWLWVAGRNEDD